MAIYDQKLIQLKGYIDGIPTLVSREILDANGL